MIASVPAHGTGADHLPLRYIRHQDDAVRERAVARLRVECAGGIGHHPDESVSEQDVALAIEAAAHFACSI
jgi:hypothetical protein